MVLEDRTSKIKACAQQMNARYAGIVFDKWPVVSLAENKRGCLTPIAWGGSGLPAIASAKTSEWSEPGGRDMDGQPER